MNQTFIQATFPSVWSLEMLLLLASEPGRGWTASELVAALRASEQIVRQSLTRLVAAGLTDMEGDRIVYRPITPDLGRMVEDVRNLYQTSPGRVRRMIIAANPNSPSALADAFRLRKD